MAELQQIIDHAEQSCKAHGARLTTKRKQVLSALLLAGRALSAYELVDYCKQELGETIPAMSVYRILDFLQGEGLVHRLNSANKYIACAHISCDHDHAAAQFLICTGCERVEEITIPKSTMNTLKNHIEESGFQLQKPQLEIDCICNRCTTP